MDGVCRHNLLASGIRSFVLKSPAGEACCYVMSAEGVESDSHKCPWMHEAQLSLMGTWALVSLAKPPVVSDSGNNTQPRQTPRPQLSSNHDSWRRNERRECSPDGTIEGKRQATRQARRPGSGFLTQRGK